MTAYLMPAKPQKSQKIENKDSPASPNSSPVLDIDDKIKSLTEVKTEKQ